MDVDADIDVQVEEPASINSRGVSSFADRALNSARTSIQKLMRYSDVNRGEKLPNAATNDD